MTSRRPSPFPFRRVFRKLLSSSLLFITLVVIHTIMLSSLTSLLALATTFCLATAQASSSEPATPSTTGFRVLPRGPFVPVGKDFVGPAYQGVQWGNKTLGADERYPCIVIGYSPLFPSQVCSTEWYNYDRWRQQDGVACPDTMITGESERWIAVSDAFVRSPFTCQPLSRPGRSLIPVYCIQLNKNGSLRKSCGRKVVVTAEDKRFEAEIRRSCNSTTACPGENAITVSTYLAKDLGIWNDVYNGTEVSWKYI